MLRAMRRKQGILEDGALDALAGRLGGPVAGVDEVGRGPWAGPVVAAAVTIAGTRPPGLADSKTLSPARRAALAAALGQAEGVAWALGRAEAAEIDALGLGPAADLAMARALAALAEAAPVAGALVDGNRVPRGLAIPAECLVGGDGRVGAIAAASILAKVARDAEMDALARRRPGYGWERNKGYGTAEHRAGLLRLGVAPEHRRSFRPIAQILDQETSVEI